MERRNVRTWAVQTIAGAALLASLAGSPVSAREQNGFAAQPASASWNWGLTGGIDPTGGASFSETLGGDAAALAEALGFEVFELYPGRHVARPTAANGPFDALYFCEILNVEDPGSGAEPDFFVRAPEGSQSNGFILPSSYGRAQFVRQPALSAIRTTAAHRHSTGGGVVVAVLDTGIDATHSLFEGRVLPGRDFVDLDADASEGVPDGIDQDGDGEADDGFGHGTSVAGVVLAAAPDARILPVRVLDAEARGTASSLAAGIHYAVDAGASVINLSLGALGYSSVVRGELERAFESNVIVVAAAGNTRGASQAEFPANTWGVIAATGSPGVPGDVWAPAVNVVGPYPAERWSRGRGTSFAAALVSGGAALARRQDASVSVFEIVFRLPEYRRHIRWRLDLLRLVQ